MVNLNTNELSRPFHKICSFISSKNKTAAEVAWHLLEIFLTFGAPAILQSDNGKEFVASVITELKQLWPDLKIVHGRPRHPQSQGSVERSKGEIKKNSVVGFAIINLLNGPLE